MTTPEVVLLTPVWPARSGNGLAMRAGVLLMGLALSHRVHVVVAPVIDSPQRDDLLDAHACTTTVLDLDEPADPRQETLEMLGTPAGRDRAAALGWRPSLSASLTTGAAREVAAVAQGAALVWTLRLYLAPLLDTLLDEPAPGTRIAIDVDDLDAVVQTQLGEPGEAACYERLEHYYLPRAELVTAASAADATGLARRHGLARTAGVPNAVIPPAFVGEGPADFDLLFVGNLSYAPNIEAACWLAAELGPQLGSPDIAIVGSQPTAEVRALAQLEGVTVAADVDDVAPYYARSALAVAPLASGGGTRIKIIEALAHGRPVVATPLGAEGIELQNDDGLVIAERAGFAAACSRLLADRPAARAQGLAGRAAVQRRLSTVVVAAAIDELTRDILRP